MKNPTLTVESILALKPCERYTENNAAYLKELFGDRKEVLLSEILRDTRVRRADKNWVVDVLCDDNRDLNDLYFDFNHLCTCTLCSNGKDLMSEFADLIEGKQ